MTLIILPALAQEEGGLSLTLGVEQRFEAGDNLGLERPEEGNSALSTTSLTFGLDTATSNQSLSATAGFSLRAGEVPSSSDTETGFVEPQFTFNYMREGYDSVFNVDGSYRESDIAFTSALSDFTDETGVIVLPEDFQNLDGSGTRRNYSLRTSLETGRNAPLGFVFDANVRGISYDQQSANLDDNFRYGAGVRANLRFTEVTTGFAAYNFDHFESDDAQNTERDTNAIEVGVAQELSERASFEAAIGFTDVEEELNGFSMSTSGLTGRFSFNYLMPDGAITSSYSTTVDQDGSRHTINVGRSFELPRGMFAIDVGATKEESADADLIGSVRYTQQLPTGSFSVGLNRGVSTNSDDNERITTTADLGYDHEINNLSSIGFDLSFGLSEASGGNANDDTRRTDVSASYRRQVTSDWSMTTGVAYRVRDEDIGGKSDSTSIFLTLNRDFNLLR
ncbi:hypothetical protein AAFO92_20815 [Roseovarius sp. CAU 1744]|uniref:hypothetical protein n=1 Tax=Roseovarius sp. CAU 1744 TaxID=3140368 RepID=UPI00325A77A1